MNSSTKALLLIKMHLVIAFSIGFSTLVLYMTNKLELSDSTAISIFTWGLACTSISRIIAGFLCDRYLQPRTVLLLGAFAVGLGSCLFAIPTLTVFYVAIAIFSMGNGFLVAVNCLLSELFEFQDLLREKAFLLNYSGMNVGHLIGLLLSGYYQLKGAYDTLFILGGIASIAAMVIILVYWNTLRIPDKKLPITQKQCEQVKSLRPYVVLALISIFYWTLYHFTPTMVTLFIARDVDRNIFGYEIAPQWFHVMSVLIIVLGGPMLTTIFSQLRSNGVNITLLHQLSFAILLFCLSLFILSTQASVYWVLICLALQGLSELLVAPTGFAAIAKLVPSRSKGIMMGLWMLTIGIGSSLSGLLATL